MLVPMFQDCVRNGQKKVESRRRAEGELGNEHQLFELQRGGDNFFAEVGEVIAIRVTHLLDESVERRRFNKRDTWPPFFSGRWSRKLRFCRPRILNSPRARTCSSC